MTPPCSAFTLEKKLPSFSKPELSMMRVTFKGGFISATTTWVRGGSSIMCSPESASFLSRKTLHQEVLFSSLIETLQELSLQEFPEPWLPSTRICTHSR